ncbi:hypothetical protein BDW75DRAFT_226431 [Aspergillus navahoensis]
MCLCSKCDNIYALMALGHRHRHVVLLAGVFVLRVVVTGAEAFLQVELKHKGPLLLQSCGGLFFYLFLPLKKTMVYNVSFYFCHKEHSTAYIGHLDSFPSSTRSSRFLLLYFTSA